MDTSPASQDVDTSAVAASHTTHAEDTASVVASTAVRRPSVRPESDALAVDTNMSAADQRTIARSMDSGAQSLRTAAEQEFTTPDVDTNASAVNHVSTAEPMATSAEDEDTVASMASQPESQDVDVERSAASHSTPARC